jgi:hypothetical protein
MTTVQLTPAKLRLLEIQHAQGIPYPGNILTWRKAHAAILAAMENERQAEPGA